LDWIELKAAGWSGAGVSAAGAGSAKGCANLAQAATGRQA